MNFQVVLVLTMLFNVCNIPLRLTALAPARPLALQVISKSLPYGVCTAYHNALIVPFLSGLAELLVHIHRRIEDRRWDSSMSAYQFAVSMSTFLHIWHWNSARTRYRCPGVFYSGLDFGLGAVLFFALHEFARSLLTHLLWTVTPFADLLPFMSYISGSVQVLLVNLGLSTCLIGRVQGGVLLRSPQQIWKVKLG